MSFNTSANNHARIYLVSDREDLEGPLEGYFLQAGGSSDSVVFYRQQGDLLTSLFTCSGLFTGRSANTLRFIVTRDDSGSWEVLADSAGGMNFLSQGTFSDIQVASRLFSASGAGSPPATGRNSTLTIFVRHRSLLIRFRRGWVLQN